jgi:hypothetical protein
MKKKKGTRRRRGKSEYFGLSFDPSRTKSEHGAISLLFENPVSFSVPKDSTDFDVLTLMAENSNNPIPIGFLSEELEQPTPPRGDTLFGEIAMQIDAVVSRYHTLRWWLSRQGLVVDKASPELDRLSMFDRLVGPLSVDLVVNKKLPITAIYTISEKLDLLGFKLNDHLEPTGWEEVVALNRRRTGKRVESFTSASKNSQLVRHVRRSIYRARDRYKQAIDFES